MKRTYKRLPVEASQDFHHTNRSTSSRRTYFTATGVNHSAMIKFANIVITVTRCSGWRIHLSFHYAVRNRYQSQPKA